MGENWYVLYTTPRAEKKVADRLKDVAGISVYLPMHKTPRKWSDRIKMVEVPLFSSYVFVKTNPENLFNVLKIPGAVRFIWFNGQPAVMHISELEAIQKFLCKAEGRECRYEVDEEIRIAFGPLKDHTGKVKKVRGKYLVLILEKTGMEVMVEIDRMLKK
jgi:transcription antitermination factor NusG